MELRELSAEMARFVDEKGWNNTNTLKPQTARNLAISLSIEAAELLELFQWSDSLPDHDALASELADVCLYLLQMASVAGIDLEKAVLDKLKTNYDRTW